MPACASRHAFISICIRKSTPFTHISRKTYITLQCIALHDVTLHCFTLDLPVHLRLYLHVHLHLYTYTLHYVYFTLLYITLHYRMLQGKTRQDKKRQTFITLHYATLRYITLHYVHTCRQTNRQTNRQTDIHPCHTIPCHTMPCHAIPCHNKTYIPICLVNTSGITDDSFDMRCEPPFVPSTSHRKQFRFWLAYREQQMGCEDQGTPFPCSGA